MRFSSLFVLGLSAGLFSAPVPLPGLTDELSGNEVIGLATDENGYIACINDQSSLKNVQY
jgi:hypothetical protein